MANLNTISNNNNKSYEQYLDSSSTLRIDSMLSMFIDNFTPTPGWQSGWAGSLLLAIMSDYFKPLGSEGKAR